jgi:cell division transport system permease protein
MMTKSILVAWQRISRAPYQTVAAVSIMTMTLFLAGTFTMVAAGSQTILHYFETRPQINAYFKTEYVPASEEIASTETAIQSTGLVQTFKYVSKEEALMIYKELNKSDPLLLEAVTAEMLPASYEVSGKNPQDLKPISEALKQIPNIEDVRYAEDIISSLSAWTNFVRLTGIALVGTHILITLITILLVIGIKVANRRDEISILSLVGATPGYISAPFIWEGVIYGLMGGFIAWTVTFGIWVWSQDLLNKLLTGIPVTILPLVFVLELLGAELAIGAVVGSIGAIIATRRFVFKA